MIELNKKVEPAERSKEKGLVTELKKKVEPEKRANKRRW